MFFERSCAVARLSPNAADNDKEQYATLSNLSNIPLNLQPANGEVTALVGGVFGQTYTGFVSVSGIAVGDRLTVSGTNDQFFVKGVRDWYYAPIPHVELVLFKHNG